MFAVGGGFDVEPVDPVEPHAEASRTITAATPASRLQAGTAALSLMSSFLAP